MHQKVEKQKFPTKYKISWVILHPESKILTPEKLNKYISAEIPSENSKLQNLVIKHMLHGPHTNESFCYNVETNECT